MLIVAVPLIVTLPGLIGATPGLIRSNRSVAPVLLPTVNDEGANWLTPEGVTPSVAPSLTVIAPAPVCAVLSTSVPLLTLVAPLYVFAPVNDCAPALVFVILNERVLSRTMPVKVADALPAPSVKV